MLLINHAMLIIRIGGIYNGKGEIHDSNLDKLRIWDISVCKLNLLASRLYIPFTDTSYGYI